MINTEILYLTFLTGFAAMILWMGNYIYFINKFYQTLKKDYPEIWAALGQPSVGKFSGTALQIQQTTYFKGRKFEELNNQRLRTYYQKATRLNFILIVAAGISALSGILMLFKTN